MENILLVWEHVRNYGCNEGGLLVISGDVKATVFPGKIVFH